MGRSGVPGIAQLGDLPCDGTRSASWWRSLVDPGYERSPNPRSVIHILCGVEFCHGFQPVLLYRHKGIQRERRTHASPIMLIHMRANSLDSPLASTRISVANQSAYALGAVQRDG